MPPREQTLITPSVIPNLPRAGPGPRTEGEEPAPPRTEVHTGRGGINRRPTPTHRPGPSGTPWARRRPWLQQAARLRHTNDDKQTHGSRVRVAGHPGPEFSPSMNAVEETSHPSHWRPRPGS